LFLVVQVLPLPADPGPAARVTLGTVLWMATWWVSDCLAFGVTALLPLGVFPLLGVNTFREVSAVYFHPLVVLLMGGFLMAAALERWQLHRRAALAVLATVGRSKRSILWAFMGVAAFFSMWISNTATTLMLLPIAIATITNFEQRHGPDQELRIGVLLGIAWAASIGGMATLVGTPPNLILLGQPGMEERLDFAGWMGVGLPASLVLWPVAAWLLGRRFSASEVGAFRGARQALLGELRAMGRMDRGSWTTLAVVGTAALGWVTRRDLDTGLLVIPGWSRLMRPWVERGVGGEIANLSDYVGDASVAIVAALLLLTLPGGRDPDRSGSDRLLDWQRVQDLPWGVLLLFGGGFALAGAVQSSGLAEWIGAGASRLSALPLPIMVLCICLGMTFTTEVTMNTSVTALMLPVLAASAESAGHDPLLWMLPATLSASCAFMLPTATAPNAIVFGSGWITIPEMARRGLVLNLIGAGLLTLVVMAVSPAQGV
jgi:sodium-dependent dicarboxylate transporter 2/3/5